MAHLACGCCATFVKISWDLSEENDETLKPIPINLIYTTEN